MLIFQLDCSKNNFSVLWIFRFFYFLLQTFWRSTDPKIRIFQSRISSVQSLSCVWLFATPWTAAHKASLSITDSQSLLKLMSIESVMLSNDLILCHPLLFLPSIFPSIRVFSKESVLHIRWPEYWNFSFSISPFNSGLISFRIGLISLHSKEVSRVFSDTTIWKHQFLPALCSSFHIHAWLLEKP